MYPEYFADKPVERLLGEGIKAEYINDDTQAIRLARGYSRDHRPELNQVVLLAH